MQLCAEHDVQITEEMAERMTPEKCRGNFLTEVSLPGVLTCLTREQEGAMFSSKIYSQGFTPIFLQTICQSPSWTLLVSGRPMDRCISSQSSGWKPRHDVMGFPRKEVQLEKTLPIVSIGNHVHGSF